MTQDPQTGSVTSAAGKVVVTGKIVTGVDIEGAASDAVLKAALETMQHWRTGGVSGYQGVEAGEVVTGLRYFNPQTPDKASFLAELQALRQELANLAAQPGSPAETQAAVEALDVAAAESQKEQPLPKKIINNLQLAVGYITDAGKIWEAAAKAGPYLLQALTVATTLYQAAQKLF